MHSLIEKFRYKAYGNPATYVLADLFLNKTEQHLKIS